MKEKEVLINKADAGKVYQLRIYQIFEKNREAFYERFENHCIPIMKRYGFHILKTWDVDDDLHKEFVYLIEWPDEETMRKQWELFMADEEWTEVKERTTAMHGNMVGYIEERVMREVL